LEVVERVFPEHEWSHGIPYPNLVVLAGQIEEYVAVARAIRMVGERASWQNVQNASLV
jgi:hypothetical protein